MDQGLIRATDGAHLALDLEELSCAFLSFPVMPNNIEAAEFEEKIDYYKQP